MRRFFDFELRWLLAIFSTLIPSGASERLPEGAREANLAGFVDDLLQRAPLQMLLGLRVCLWVLTFSPLFWLGRLTTFFGLDEDEKLELLDRLSRSPVYLLREIPMLFKMLACLGYGGLPKIQARLAISPRDKTPPSWVEP